MSNADLFTDQRDAGKDDEEVSRRQGPFSGDCAAACVNRSCIYFSYVMQVYVCGAMLISQGMEDWDQETLERVIKEKHGNEKPSNATSIPCKHFIDAVEKKLYGWYVLWVCAVHSHSYLLPAGHSSLRWPVLMTQVLEVPQRE